MNPFDIKETKLDGSTMLEASAGTGKTYSVAILVLRLILEKKIPLEKILMVTFTNAAVAELEARIRLFVRLSNKHACGEDIEDKNIKEIVGPTDAIKKDLLRKAVQSLDNLSVMTIHSFCQKTIGEFTFETNQAFDFEIVTEDAFILKNASSRFVRETLNVLNYGQFKQITKDLKIVKMHELLRKHLQGMKFLDNNEEDFDFSNKVKLEREKYFALKQAIEENFENIKNANINGSTKLAKRRNSPEEFLPVFIEACCQKPPSNHAIKLGFIYEPFGREYAEAALDVSLIYQHFFNKSQEAINQIKKSRGYISYDDQIKTIHAALQNPQFIKNMKEKYEAVFIDEFQDTDKYQYEIFSRIFEGKSLFYIGDPKQSIYGWRSADLDTYKEARANVGEKKTFTLGTNFRSTPEMLKALEKLMGGVDMFEDPEIKFEEVSAGKSDMGELFVEGIKTAPVTIWKFDEKDYETSNAAVAQEIFLLLQNGKIGKEEVKPRDIGVLVKTNKDGRAIKKALARFNIPAVQRDDTKVLESDEAGHIRYLILAVLNPKRNEINRAIQSRHFGFPHDKIKDLSEDEHIEVFLKLKNVLREKGVYNMIAQFLDVYGIRKSCMENVEGQRVLSNIHQIAEILHRLERRAKLKPEDLVVWMERNREDSSEEYQQRIESDDEAVQIATIHKAKGLEYKIVFAPTLNMVVKSKFLYRKNVNFFKKEKDYCFTFNYPDLEPNDKALFNNQKFQENRRLIYVALTRAAYKCYISYIPQKFNPERKEEEPAFEKIYQNVSSGSDGIEIIDLSQDQFKKIKGQYKPKDETTPTFTPRIPDPTLAKDGIKAPLQVHSFSALNKKHFTAPFEKQDLEEAYDHFIFQELGRGANVGTALHSIFERLDFNKPDTWEKTLAESAKYYPNILKEEECKGHFKTLVKHTLETDISINGENFQLNQITQDKMLPELQFYFSMEQVNKTVINSYLGEEAYLGGDADLQGMMTGFVDLLFEHNGKYYILDWKSNHLGNSVESYNAAGLDAAMKASNYNLQYMIYTVAVKRWLETKIKDFNYDKHFGGVIYLFLRGIRKGSETGIFTTVPERKKIEELEKAFSTSDPES